MALYEDICEAKEQRVINPNDTADTTILELPDGGKMLTCTTAPDYNGSIFDIYIHSMRKTAHRNLSQLCR